MNIDNLELEICQAVRQKVDAAYQQLISEVSENINTAKANEQKAETPESKKFFEGVHVGMTDVVIKLNLARI